MNGASAISVFLYAGVLFLVVLLAALLWRPLKFFLRLLFRSAVGCTAILIINTLFAHTSLQIALNAITALLCAFLGIGGVAFLVVFNLFL